MFSCIVFLVLITGLMNRAYVIEAEPDSIACSHVRIVCGSFRKFSSSSATTVHLLFGSNMYFFQEHNATYFQFVHQSGSQQSLDEKPAALPTAAELSPRTKTSASK